MPSPTSPLPSPGTLRRNQNATSLIYDKNIYRNNKNVSLSSLQFLIMEIVSQHMKNTNNILKIERKLNNLGYSIGLKYLNLISTKNNFINNITSNGKSNTSHRITKLIDFLHFISNDIWLSLFNKSSNGLEKSSDNEFQFMIIDNNPIISSFLSPTQEYNSLSIESFTAGIIEGILDTAYFQCEVSAHRVPIVNYPNKTIYLINLKQ